MKSFPDKIYFIGKMENHNPASDTEIAIKVGDCIIELDRDQLSESLKLADKSPAGFSYGFNGSGPAQTALAICRIIYGPLIAMQVFQKFKTKFIAGLPQTNVATGFDLSKFNKTVIAETVANIEHTRMIYKTEYCEDFDECAKADNYQIFIYKRNAFKDDSKL